MKEIIILSAVTALTFIVFSILLIIGIVKKNKIFITVSVCLLVVSVGFGVYVAYDLYSKSVKKISDLLKPRTGEEIYDALFGKAKHDCVEILNYRDQTVPKIDYAIKLHFITCPAELNRILSLYEFDENIISTKAMRSESESQADEWFAPEKMGDSILIYVYNKDDYGNDLIIYSSLEKSEVFCIDILD